VAAAVVTRISPFIIGVDPTILDEWAAAADFAQAMHAVRRPPLFGSDRLPIPL